MTSKNYNPAYSLGLELIEALQDSTLTDGQARNICRAYMAGNATLTARNENEESALDCLSYRGFTRAIEYFLDTVIEKNLIPPVMLQDLILEALCIAEGTETRIKLNKYEAGVHSKILKDNYPYFESEIAAANIINLIKHGPVISEGMDEEVALCHQVQTLLPQADLEYRDNSGYSAFDWAAANNYSLVFTMMADSQRKSTAEEGKTLSKLLRKAASYYPDDSINSAIKSALGQVRQGPAPRYESSHFSTLKPEMS